MRSPQDTGNSLAERRIDMAKRTVNVGVARDLKWPQVCVLCLNDASEELFTAFNGWPQAVPVPYCASCHDRVRRFTNWKDSLFMISVLFGAIGGIIAVIGIVVESGWAELLHIGDTIMLVSAGFLLFFGVCYVLLWLLLLPMRLIMRSRLASPGVKRLKSKDPLVAPLKFTNSEYARRFQEINAIT
jgi:hypothetical protein